MSHIFRIHKTGIVQVKDWDKSRSLTDEDINSIPDTIHLGSAAKLGSSIPSPFARMYLFDTAFKMVNLSTSVGNTMYHQLVSDCIDMFQFLYLFSDNSDVTFKIWDKDNQLKEMLKSAFNEHRQLGAALELFFNTKKFKSLDQIVLVYYKNKLVGGTSPISVLYTSPNWQRIIDENGWNSNFKTSGADILFDKVPYAIQQRDEDFVKYMYRFVYAHNQEISEQSESFFNYFVKIRRENSRIEDFLTKESVSVEYTKEQFLNDYSEIKIDPENDKSKDVLYSSDCVILKPKEEDTVALIQKSDFIISNTVDYYKNQKDENNVVLGIQRPLVLIKGNHKLNYIDSNWDTRTVVPDVPSIPLHKRKLPDNNYTYPYLTTGDFLEDALVETAYNINSERFFTGFQGNFNFLLPIKKLYFNFFKLEDLEKQLTIIQNGDTVKVELKIPITNEKYIEFSRSYDRNDNTQVIRYKGLKGFNLGIFPFYKVIDKPNQNRYSIALISNVEDLNIQFYRFHYLEDKIPVRVKESVRSKHQKITAGSRYYSIQGESFDLIEAVVGETGVKGLIIPLFNEIDTEENRTQYTFAIDFGTTNTYVAYTNLGAESKELAVDKNDRQMVLLSELKTGKKELQDQILDGFGALRSFSETFDREFVPSFIGRNSPFNYPHRTVICEHYSYALGSPRLFENINIGYYLELDPGVSIGQDTNSYHPDLKWGMDTNRSGKEKERVEMYIKETLWLIKNKILLNNGNLKPVVIWMVPLSMKKRIRNIFEEIWKDQVQKVFGEDHSVELKMKYESIVPYYGLEKEGMSIGRSANVINIDIGGGTTDAFFFYKKDDQFYSTSFRFAGNDLWGEGLSESIKKDNGFFKMMETSITRNKESFTSNYSEVLAVYESFVKTPKLNSSDICSLLFKYNKVFKFSDHIKNHEPLSSLLVIHLAVILYHIAQIIKDKSLTLPQFISFTGRGSEYIKLISTNERDVYELVSTLLEIFSDQDMPVKSRVVMVEKPKQLTAEGAVLHEFSNERVEIDAKAENIVHLGFDNASGADPLSPMLIGNVDQIEKGVMDQFSNFLKLLRDARISRLLKKLEISFRFGDYDIIEELEKFAVLSYDEQIYRLKEDADQNDEIEESPFFWLFKDSLYRLSQELYQLKP